MKLSIIVPVYNAAQFLDECIQSVINQNYTNWELIIVNDGSTDNSETVIKKYLKEDKRIKYFYKQNSGVTFSRWIGIEKATGDIVMFLDADDILLENCLQLVANNFDTYDLLSINIQSFVSRNEIKIINKTHFERIDYRVETLVADILSGRYPTGVYGWIFKKDKIVNYKNIFCNGLRIAEDLMFLIEYMIAEIPEIAVTPDALYGYRTNLESVTHSVGHQRFDSIYAAIQTLNQFEIKYPVMCADIKESISFRKLLLWSTFVFNPDNKYYKDKALRREMRELYFIAFNRLYPYLRFYLFVDFFLGSWFSKRIIKKSSIANKKTQL